MIRTIGTMAWRRKAKESTTSLPNDLFNFRYGSVLDSGYKTVLDLVQDLREAADLTKALVLLLFNDTTAASDT